MNYFVIGLIFGLGFRLGSVIINFACDMLSRGMFTVAKRIDNVVGHEQNGSGKKTGTKMKIGF